MLTPGLKKILKIKITHAIETFGLCGAGKSTILKELVPILMMESGGLYPVFEKPVDPGAIATFIETGRIILKVSKRDPTGLLKFLIAYKNWWLPLKLGYRSAGMKTRNRKQVALLIDCGLLQPFISFEVEVNTSEKGIPLHAFLLAISLPALVIYVRVSAEKAFQRYVTRNIIAGKGLKKNHLRRRFENGFRICEQLHEIYLTLGLPLWVLDAEEKINHSQLQEFARQILNSPLIKNRQ